MFGVTRRPKYVNFIKGVLSRQGNKKVNLLLKEAKPTDTSSRVMLCTTLIVPHLNNLTTNDLLGLLADGYPLSYIQVLVYQQLADGRKAYISRHPLEQSDISKDFLRR